MLPVHIHRYYCSHEPLLSYSDDFFIDEATKICVSTPVLHFTQPPLCFSQTHLHLSTLNQAVIYTLLVVLFLFSIFYSSQPLCCCILSHSQSTLSNLLWSHCEAAAWAAASRAFSPLVWITVSQRITACETAPLAHTKVDIHFSYRSPFVRSTDNNSSINKVKENTAPGQVVSPYTLLSAQSLGWPRGHPDRSVFQSACVMSVVTGGSNTAWDQPMSNESVCSQFFVSVKLKRDWPQWTVSLPRVLQCSQSAPSAQAYWRYTYTAFSAGKLVFVHVHFS